MIKLSKEESEKRINLRKKAVIKLTKETPLENLTSRVALVLDFSGSMDYLYENGEMQEVIERILPIAMKFDDNGEMDFWIFDDGFIRLDGVTLDNFYGLTERLLRKYSFGATEYSPVIRDIVNYYIVEEPMNIPNYVIFITDGENSDREQATEIITQASKYPIFFQFVGIGDENFRFLNQLDNMDGRYVDNANFFEIKDLSSISDDELYHMLLSEYPQWLEYPEVKEMFNSTEKLKKVRKKEKKKKFNVGAFVVDLIEGILDAI